MTLLTLHAIVSGIVTATATVLCVNKWGFKGAWVAPVLFLIAFWHANYIGVIQ